ncbi:MAG: molecular chaperone HtpG, partial [Clostridiales bacterium]
GSLAFKEANADQKDLDIIGQFGVGFYSAFMVSKKIEVLTKAVDSDQAYLWQSEGVDGYTVEEAQKDDIGTIIKLYIKDNDQDHNYDSFLEPYSIKNLVKKYSDYIRYPIVMDIPHRKPVEGKENEFDEVMEAETLNSMVPIWKKSKNEISDEEYNNFYKEKFFAFEDPLRIIHHNVEGASSYTALLYIPGHAPYNYYTKDFEKGLQLYSNGVLIMDKCGDLLPDCFSFMAGLVDSQDLSLNISREMLQHDRQLKNIAHILEKKIRGELADMLAKEREKYEQFFNNFGLQLKYGIYSGYGQQKELLEDLLLYYSSSEKKMVTLAEYLGRMKEDQKAIYYACGESIAKLDMFPQT